MYRRRHIHSLAHLSQYVCELRNNLAGNKSEGRLRRQETRYVFYISSRTRKKQSRRNRFTSTLSSSGCLPQINRERRMEQWDERYYTQCTLYTWSVSLAHAFTAAHLECGSSAPNASPAAPPSNQNNPSKEQIWELARTKGFAPGTQPGVNFRRTANRSQSAVLSWNLSYAF